MYETFQAINYFNFFQPTENQGKPKVIFNLTKDDEYSFYKTYPKETSIGHGGKQMLECD